MSRRLIKAGHEVHGYRNNYKKSEEQFEKGYISGCTTSLESLVQVVHQGNAIYGEKSGETVYMPGVFMMVVPAETVEDTLNSYYSFVTREILLLIMAIAILRTVGGGQSVLQNWASHILTVVLVVVCTVWSVDSVSWLVAESLQSMSAVLSLTHSHQVSTPL